MIISDLVYLEGISEKTSFAVSGGTRVTVNKGDTLSELTSLHYANGTSSCYKPIARINNIKPNDIYAGQKLNFPSKVKGCGYLISRESGLRTG